MTIEIATIPSNEPENSEARKAEIKIEDYDNEEHYAADLKTQYWGGRSAWVLALEAGDMSQAEWDFLVQYHRRRETMALVGPPVNRKRRAGISGGVGDDDLAEGLPEADLTFFSRRPAFQEIWRRAWDEEISPWGLLGVVLAHVSSRVGPHVILPPLSGKTRTGGHGSLNYWVGLVSKSGGGKGTCLSVGKAMFQPGASVRIPEHEPATAQGIDAAFAQQHPKAGVVQYNDAALLVAPEVDSLVTAAKSAGSTTLPVMRKVWSGEALGAQYADATKRRRTEAHRYRAAVIVGIQKANSGPLLDAQETAGGTPQRIVWLPAVDLKAIELKEQAEASGHIAPDVPSVQVWEDREEWAPYGLDWKMEDADGNPVSVGQKPWVTIDIPESIMAEIRRRVRQAKRDGELGVGDPADGHAVHCQEKTAALLALLDGRTNVTDEDWELAAQVAQVSARTRDECRAEVRKALTRANREKGRSRAEQYVAESSAQGTIRDERKERLIDLTHKAFAVLTSQPGLWVSPRDVNKAIGDADAVREFGSDVFDSLRAVAGMEEGPEEMRGGRRVRRWRYTPQ